VIGETDYAPALSLKERGAGGIVSLGERMGIAIELDPEAFSPRCKVDHVGFHGDLPAEFPALQAMCAQNPPHRALRRRHVAPQPLGLVDALWIARYAH
jgi:hypothetical protein